MTFWLILILLLILFWLLWMVLCSPGLDRNELSRFSFNQLTLRNGFSVNYREVGSENGRKILCLHGGGDSLSTWNAWNVKMGQKYHLILVDMPGHGLTDPLAEGTYTPKHFANFIAEFVEALQLEDFVIVGHSFGGNGVLRYLTEHPEIPKAAILISPCGYKCGKGLEMSRTTARFVTNHWGRWLVSHLGSRGILRKMLRSKFVYDPQALPEEMLERIYLLSRYEKNRGTVINLVANATLNFQPLSGLENIKLPVLLIWGAEDQIVPLQIGQYFCEKLPRGELVVYQKIGHLPQVENAAQSATDAMQFLHREGLE
ncbi:alpha/beta hydrolase [Microbulbifer sp. OS29]|uniref:Alpha/beta hydrolase n=1 Tax=Microbulbifer okhotskensis TaxID=2926617 RepID=A0A9X2END8_9GAMM|nr:alpha/beta hydrolase [Microbulbifer okhotskensis]MCO1332783.1 alpha/beta hydrolase [Microbulbifer okhotskensis]